jgi:hypothetical protein
MLTIRDIEEIQEYVVFPPLDPSGGPMLQSEVKTIITPIYGLDAIRA